MNDLSQLAAMNYDQRIEWKIANTRYRMGLYFTKIDGKLACVGGEDEADDMVARFLMFIARNQLDVVITTSH